MLSLGDLIAGYEAERLSPVDPRMQSLVEHFIEPNVDAIVRDMFALRTETDRTLIERFAGQVEPVPEGEEPKSYPVSYCLEITRHMLHLMSRAPAPDHMTGLRALHDFIRAGGLVKRVWGALRGTYFQNAIQVGSYYLDVANDTVNPAKDDVEMLPLAASGFRSIESYFEFEDVARLYWKCHTIPNLYFPNLAPFFPLITFSKRGMIRLDSVNAYMFPMNIVRSFAPAREFVFGRMAAGDNEPYVAFLRELAARETHMHRPDALLYFTPSPDVMRLERNFDRMRRAHRPAVEAELKDVLSIDPTLWRLPAGSFALQRA